MPYPTQGRIFQYLEVPIGELYLLAGNVPQPHRLNESTYLFVHRRVGQGGTVASGPLHG